MTRRHGRAASRVIRDATGSALDRLPSDRRSFQTEGPCVRPDGAAVLRPSAGRPSWERSPLGLNATICLYFEPFRPLRSRQQHCELKDQLMPAPRPGGHDSCCRSLLSASVEDSNRHIRWCPVALSRGSLAMLLILAGCINARTTRLPSLAAGDPRSEAAAYQYHDPFPERELAPSMSTRPRGFDVARPETRRVLENSRGPLASPAGASAAAYPPPRQYSQAVAP